MLYLNTRHTLPMLGFRNRLATLDSHAIRPQAHRDYVAPRSNMGVTAPTIEVDTYPSRHSYGYTNNTDFARENKQRGESELRSSVSKHTQEAWAMAENAAKKGHNEINAQYDSDLSSKIHKQRYIEAQAIPDPVITVHPSELRGTPDPGKDEWSVDVANWADIKFNPGNLEGYMRVQGEIHSWVSEGHYDIYA